MVPVHSGEWVRYRTVHCDTVRYDTVRYRYGNVPYGTVRYRYSDVWITNDNVFTRFIKYFELSKNCRKVRVLGVMIRTSELGNTG